MQNDFICKKCGGRTVAVKDETKYEDKIAVICQDCGKWQKWLKKQDFETWPHNRKVINKLSWESSEEKASTGFAYVSSNANNILRAAQKEYGCEFEKYIVIEEMSELIKEITKDLRGQSNGKNIAEEMADVFIVLRHLELIYQNSDEVNEVIAQKIERLKTRLESEQGDNAYLDLPWL